MRPSELQTEVDLASMLVDRALDDIPRTQFARCRASELRHFSVGDDPITDESFQMDQFVDALVNSVRSCIPPDGKIQFVKPAHPGPEIDTAFAKEGLPLRAMSVLDCATGKILKRFDLLALIT